MKRKIAIVALMILALPMAGSAGINRIDVSPMALINLDREGDADSRFLGGAVAADFYFKRHFAIRTSIGYVKNLYNTDVSRIDRLFGDLQPVEDDNYSLRFSIAPYAEGYLAGGLRPYITISGGIGYLDNNAQVSDISSVQGGSISNSQYVRSSSSVGTYYDFTGAIGLKVPVFENVSLFGEVSHRIYSSIDTDRFNSVDATYSQVPFGFNQYKTMLSLGLSYSFNISNQ